MHICYHSSVEVVVDTSVFVSALLGPGGASREVVRACLDGRLEPLMGNALYTEFEDLLGRRDLFAESSFDAARREVLLNAFLSACRWVRIYYLWRPNLPDEADNHVVELAIAGGASTVITKNVRDFVRAELRFPSLHIYSPEEMVQELTR